MKHGRYLREGQSERVTRIGDEVGIGTSIEMETLESLFQGGNLQVRMNPGTTRFYLTLAEEKRLLDVLQRREAVRRGWLS